MLLVDFVKESVMALESLYPETEARSIVLMLCEDILGTERYTHIVEPQYQIDEKKQIKKYLKNTKIVMS